MVNTVAVPAPWARVQTSIRNPPVVRPPPDHPIPIDISQLVVGLYVWIDLPWTDHPFLTSRRMIESERDIALIRRARPHGLLYYYPGRSRVQPPARAAQTSEVHRSTDDSAGQDAALEFERLRQDKQKTLQRQTARNERMRRGWEVAGRQVREALFEFARTPKSAGERLRVLAQETALQVSQTADVVLDMLGEHLLKGPQHHALNVMMLSLLLGQRAGLSNLELTDLAMAALAHDAGQADIPAAVLRNAHRRRFEEDFYRQHVAFSARLAAQSGHFSATALSLIEQHHEAPDGSGWPAGRTDAQRGARILSITDRFDRLCNPGQDGVLPLSPSEALARMVRQEAARFDPPLLALFVQVMGLHPPGSVVELSDGTLGLVFTGSRQPDAPRVRLYSPGMRRDEAPVIDLSRTPELRIVASRRAADLPEEVRDWFVPLRAGA